MARRVNTRFVVTLSSVLVGALMLILGVAYGPRAWHWYQARDPDVVQGWGQTAEKNGNLAEAAGDFSRAGSLLAQQHRSGADVVFARSAELYLKLSREATSQKDAVTYYQQGMTNFRSARLENPRNQKVIETLLDEEYQDAKFQPTQAAWQTVQNDAVEMMRYYDGVKPRLYSAEALLTVARMTSDGLTAVVTIPDPNDPADVAKDMRVTVAQVVNVDLDAAQKFAPDSGKAVALRGLLMALQAEVSVKRRNLKPEEVLADRLYLGDRAAIQQLLLRFLEHRQSRLRAPGWNWFTVVPMDHVDSDVAVALASLAMGQYQLTGDVEPLNAGIQVLAAGYAADPDNQEVVELLGPLYLAMGQAEKSEALYKGIVARNPDGPEGYFRLASFYNDTGKTAAAINSYTDVTNHPGSGGGRQAQRNVEYKFRSLHQLAWLSMDMMQQKGASETQKKEYAKRSQDAIEELRTMAAGNLTVQGMVDLLDGRMYLIRQDLPHAMVSLRQAETNLSGVNNSFVRESYRRTEMLLASINEMQNQLGAALDLVHNAQAVRADYLGALEECRLLAIVGRYEEASVLLTKMTGATAVGNTWQFPLTVNMSPEAAERAIALWGLVNRRLGTPNAVNALSDNPLQMAGVAMEEGRYDDALRNFNIVIKNAEQTPNADTNAKKASAADLSAAYQSAIDCCVHLKGQSKDATGANSYLDQAKKLAADALARFPESTYFQVAKAKLDQPGGLDTDTAKQAVINAISDPYEKALKLADFYHEHSLELLQKPLNDGQDLSADELKQCQGYWDNELKVLEEIQATIKDDPESHQKLGALVDRMFGVTVLAGQLSTDSKRTDYFKAATGLVAEIQTLNIDGTNGKIAQGQLELAQGKSEGIKSLGQAVQLRPDSAKAHLELGKAYVQQGAKDREKRTDLLNLALEEFRQVIKLAPNNLTALQLATRILASEKTDAASLKEAQGYVASGLAQSPHSAFFLISAEMLDENVDKAIARRVAILAQNPEDRDNRYRLAQLYVAKKTRDLADYIELKAKANTLENQQAAERSREAANVAIQQAIQVVQGDFDTHPDELMPRDTLAQLYAEHAPFNVTAKTPENNWKEILDAINLYSPLITSKNKQMQLYALMAEAEFFRQLGGRPEMVQVLQSNKAMSEGDTQTQAVSLLKQAISVEQAVNAEVAESERQDVAERHLEDLYFANNQYKEAEGIFLSVLKNNLTPAASGAVEHRLIECELRLKEFDQADPRLADLLKAHPDDASGLTLRAYSMILQAPGMPSDRQVNALKAAVVDLTKASDLAPDNASALIYRAMAQMGIGGPENEEKARRDLLAAKKIDKDATGTASMLLAGLYVRTQQYEQAVREYQDALQMHPENLEFRAQYTNFLMDLSELLATLPKDKPGLGQTLRQLHPWEKLLEESQTGMNLTNDYHYAIMYARVLELQDHLPDALRWYAAIYKRMTTPLDDGREPPLDLEVCDAYLSALIKSKSFKSALDIANHIIEKKDFAGFVEENPQFVSLYLERAAGFKGLGDTEDMVKDVDLALAIGIRVGEKTGNLSPFVAVLNNVAVAGVSNDNTGLSLELMIERLKLKDATNAGGVVPKIGLIQLQLVKRDWAAALQVVETLPMPSNDRLKYMVLRESALVRMQDKRHYEEAEKDFKQLMSLTSNRDVDVLNNYAYVLALGNKSAEAIKVAQQAQNLLQRDSNPRQLGALLANVDDTLGWAHLLNYNVTSSMDDLRNAVDCLKESTQISPQALAYLHLAQALKKMGGKDYEAVAASMQGADLAAARHEDDTLLDLLKLGIPLAQGDKDVLRALGADCLAGAQSASDRHADATLMALLELGIPLAQEQKDDNALQIYKQLQESNKSHHP